MKDVRQSVARLDLAMQAPQRSGLVYGDRLHAILMGSAGTGKTRLLQALSWLYHERGVTKGRAPIICDAVDFADFSKNFRDNFRKAKGYVLAIENVHKLLPSGQLTQVEPIGHLIAEMSKPGNKLDPIVVLSGHPKGLREFLDANQDARSHFPHVFALSDLSAGELAELTESELLKTGFSVSAAAKDKLTRVFRLFLKNSRTPGVEPEARNAWAALKMAEMVRLDYFVKSQGAPTTPQAISEDEILLPTDDDVPLEQVLSELDSLIGMATLKAAVRSLVGEVAVQKRRLQAGTGTNKPIAFHIVLTGNPGTGKTTVARILGRLLRAIGVLELGHVVEVDRAKMVAAYVGQTAIQVNDLCDRSLGGVLFVDEAYTLKHGDDDSFGQEAIDSLLKRMEDDRGKLVVVIAGYPKEILALLNSNPGLQRRFDPRYRFHLDDYSPSDLLAIFSGMAAAEGFRLDDDVEGLALKHFERRCAQKDKTFGNGGEARTLLDACRSLHSRRLAKQNPPAGGHDDDLDVIRGCDVPAIASPATDLSQVLSEINKLIGLGSVKRELRSLIAYTQAEQLRAERGGRQTQLTLHFVFRGNPGTGKTTVARIIAQAFKALGLLSVGSLTEVGRAGLVGNHVGDTALKVNSAVDGALGGVLFVDEAYSLLGDSFGTEAITTLMQRMENDRGKLIVVVAGYSDDMDRFLDSNPGLRSRFTKSIEFTDYEPDELAAMFRDLVSEKGMILDPSADRHATELFRQMYLSRDGAFGNGRTVRTVFETAIQNQAARTAPPFAAGRMSGDEFDTILAADITPQG
ncbi:MAG: AAA family ATPase [Vicinamibacterales bacterium]